MAKAVKTYSSEESNVSERKYITLRKEASAEYEEKRSVFIATAAPVKSEASAREFIDRVKVKYSDASHNVYAYYIGGGAVARYSDDGEPQGTAGVPVFNVLKMSGADDLCVVVTRYFGGTLLGAGGLTRAYSTAARLGVQASGIVEFSEYSQFLIRCSYAEYGKIEYELAGFSAKTDTVSFTDTVSLKVAVKSIFADSFYKKINELTNARAIIENAGCRFDCE